ncbi:MAG: ROK family protein [Chitinispirillales bacterium]|nr:ROK family protein [Chitinispirillales bacterium]
MADVVAGIDIGGTNIVFGLVNRNGNIVETGTLKTADYPIFDDFVKASAYLIKDLIKKSDTNLIGVGIGAPNGNFYRGTIEYAVNLMWKGIVPIARDFKDILNVETAVTNDANAAAVGEKIFGGAKEIDDFVVLTLGTGLGSGIYINGKLLYGYSGFAGELGHIGLVPNGRACGCGQHGCAETYVSATGICRTAVELLSTKREPSVLREYSYNELTSKYISDAATEGDVIALEAFDVTARYFGKIIADTVAFSSPQKIFLFGGLANAGDILIVPAQKYAREICLQSMRDTFEITMSKLPSANAAILGSAALIWESRKKL